MLEEQIKKGAQEKGLAIMAHIVCGYPSFEANWEILEEMDKAGVDVVEMQFPFSEPIADGPLFLSANQSSLEDGTKVKDCFDLMKKASEKFSFKILMMGYYNTLFKMGEEEFCQTLAQSGGVGMIVPDLPLEEAGPLLERCNKLDLSFIRLVSPTNTRDRIGTLLDGASGFIYAVARTGVTGSKTKFTSETEEYLKFLHKNSKVPLAVGFGISQASDLEYLQGKAEMAVIGTAVLKQYLESGKAGVAEFFASLGALSQK